MLELQFLRRYTPPHPERWRPNMVGAAAVSPSILRFDQYELDLREGRLSKSGVKISLRDKSFQVLALLLEHAGEVVTREELRKHLWPNDVFVDFDNNLNMTIARLRQALRDSATRPRFIETVPRRGYRFLVTPSEPLPSRQGVSLPRPKIVVLPFVNLSGDPAQEYFSDAMTDEIITALAGLAPEHLAVIARTTAMYYKGRQKDVAHIRRELGVDYLVEGALRGNEDRVGINIQLIQTGDQTHLFAKKYEASAQQIFDLQDCIAQAIATHVPETADRIRGKQPAGGRATRKPTEDLVAYNFYLQARQQTQRCTPDPLMSAGKTLQYLGEAITRDPGFAPAHATLAEFYWWAGFLGYVKPKEAFSAGVNSALRALELDPTLGYPHVLLGTFYSRLDYNWAEAQREMALALQLDPGNPEIRFRYAEGYLLPLGRFQEAIAELERGLECDPVSLFFRFWLGYAFYLSGEHGRALAQFRFLMELAPERHPELTRTLDLGHLGEGMVCVAESRFDEGIHHYRQSIELSDGLPYRWGHLGSALALIGKTAEARRLVACLEAIAAETYSPATSIAWIYLALGDIDAGFTWLERAVDESDPHVVAIHTDPTLALLRSHPRFAALLRKMNLEA